MRPENVQSMNSAVNDSQPSMFALSKRQRSKRAWPGRTPRRSASSKRQSRKTLRRREENSGWKRRSSVCPRKSQCSKAQPSGANASKVARLKSASRMVTPSNIRTLETASMAVLLAGFGGRVDRDDVRRLKLVHPRTTLEDDALLDHERGCGDVAVHLCRAAQLDGGGGLDVADDLALDDDRAAADLRLDLGAVADHEQVVCRDLAGERPVDPDLALEGQLALELRALAEQCVQVARARGRVLPGCRVVACVSLLHGLVPFRSFLFAARFRRRGEFRRFSGTPHRRRRRTRRTARSLERNSGHYPLNARFHRTSPQYEWVNKRIAT